MVLFHPSWWCLDHSVSSMCLLSLVHSSNTLGHFCELNLNTNWVSNVDDQMSWRRFLQEVRSIFRIFNFSAIRHSFFLSISCNVSRFLSLCPGFHLTSVNSRCLYSDQRVSCHTGRGASVGTPVLSAVWKPESSRLDRQVKHCHAYVNGIPSLHLPAHNTRVSALIPKRAIFQISCLYGKWKWSHAYST